MLTDAGRSQISRSVELWLNPSEQSRSEVERDLRTARKMANDRGRAKRRHRRRCPCAPGSNPGRKPDDRHAVRKALL